MAKNMGHNIIYDHTDMKTESFFCTQISRFAIPRKLKQPHLDLYNGTGSPIDHIWTYKAQMTLATNSDELLCLAFLNTLKGLTA